MYFSSLHHRVHARVTRWLRAQCLGLTVVERKGWRCCEYSHEFKCSQYFGYWRIYLWVILRSANARLSYRQHTWMLRHATGNTVRKIAHFRYAVETLTSHRINFLHKNGLLIFGFHKMEGSQLRYILRRFLSDAPKVFIAFWSQGAYLSIHFDWLAFYAQIRNMMRWLMRQSARELITPIYLNDGWLKPTDLDFFGDHP